MPEFNADEIRRSTASEFTQAINLSFEPVSRLGHQAMTKLYLAHSDILPLRLEGITNLEPRVDAVAASALNALYRLSSAREKYVLDSYSDVSIDAARSLPIVTTAYAEIFSFIYKAQGSLAQYKGSVYDRELS